MKVEKENGRKETVKDGRESMFLKKKITVKKEALLPCSEKTKPNYTKPGSKRKRKKKKNRNQVKFR
jgi:hypothetical protein